MSVHWTNVIVLSSILILSQCVGLRWYPVIHLPVTALASSAGVLLIYLQHYFDGTDWRRRGQWDFVESGLAGSSWLQLPRVLEWFSASIGYHHIHHIDSSIPNYYLRTCFSRHPEPQRATRLGLSDCLACPTLHLWDEERERMVSFRDVASLR
jgi:omega-6 fatty acid desaturase (delta-12 desaturase)